MGRFAELLVRREELSPREELELLELAERLEQSAGEVDTIIATATFSERIRFQRALDIFTSGFASDSLARGILLHTRNDAGVTGYLGLQNSANGQMSFGIDDALGTDNTATRIFFRHDLAADDEDGAFFFSGNGSNIVEFAHQSTHETRVHIFAGAPGSEAIEIDFRGGVDGVTTVFNEQGRDIDFRVEGATVTDLLNLDAGTDTLRTGAFGTAEGAELTIATGVITATHSFHRVDTESDAASDDLDTINGDDFAGQILVIKAADSGRTVVAKDGAGNLLLAGDFSMDDHTDRLTLMSDGDNWCELSRSNNA